MSNVLIPEQLTQEQLTIIVTNSSITYQSFLNKNKFIKEKNYCYVSKNLIELLDAFDNDLFTSKKNYFFHYLFICSTIYKRSCYKDANKYVTINFDIIKTIISKSMYNTIIHNLLEWGVIEVNNSYRVDYYSKSYFLNEIFTTDIIRIQILDQLLSNKLSDHKKNKEKHMSKLPSAYRALKLNNTKIKMQNNAINYINTSIDCDNYSQLYYSYNQFMNGEYYFLVDTFGNRAHTNLTSLNTNLRNYLRVDGEQLGQIDISNSQPLFLSLYLKGIDSIDKVELQEYINLVCSGRFYEKFMDVLKTERKETKKGILMCLFDTNQHNSSSKYYNVFKSFFPTITGHLTEIKKTNYKLVAQFLQKMESNFIIERCVDRFNVQTNYSFVATIHDSIVCKVCDLEIIENIINDEFRKVGIKPTLKKEIF